MKVSVVIPAYNEEKWISKALDAVLKQDYPDYEVIVVDNASSDKTSEIVETYVKKDSRVFLVREPKKGLLNAREAGRLKAAGQIIAQMDADCIPHSTWISDAISFFETEKIVGVTGPYRFYDASPAIRTALGIGQKYIYWPASVFLRTVGKGGVYVGGNFFIRASTLKEIGGYDTSIDFYSEDSDTGYRLSKIGTVLYEPKIAVDSSARRFQAFGFKKLNNLYTKAFLTVLSGKKLKDNTETNHPR